MILLLSVLFAANEPMACCCDGVVTVVLYNRIEHCGRILLLLPTHEGEPMSVRLKVLWLLVLTVFLTALPCPAFADMVVLSNGDKVSGSLVEVSGGKVVIESPLMGTVKLLRTDVRSIRFGTKEQIEADIESETLAAIKAASKKVAANGQLPKQQVHRVNNAQPDLNGILGAALKPAANGGQLGQAGAEVDAAMKQLQQIFPGAAGNGRVQSQLETQLIQVLAGELGLGDIRNQAADASKELRAAKRDLKEMGAWSPMYDMYLGILEDFVGRVDDGEGLKR